MLEQAILGDMWANVVIITILAIVNRAACDNNTFVTSGSNAFPSSITQGKDTTIYLDHVGGYIAAIRLDSAAGSDDSDSDLWIIGKFLYIKSATDVLIILLQVLPIRAKRTVCTTRLRQH